MKFLWTSNQFFQYAKLHQVIYKKTIGIYNKNYVKKVQISHFFGLHFLFFGENTVTFLNFILLSKKLSKYCPEAQSLFFYVT